MKPTYRGLAAGLARRRLGEGAPAGFDSAVAFGSRCFAAV